MTSIRNAFLLTAVLISLWPAAARAQQGPRDTQANSLVRQAMQDYQDLEIDRSIERLNVAQRTCNNNGCSNAVLARVHMSMGVVRVGGQQNQSEGVAAMVRALQTDPHAEPDTLLATPEITQAFEEAQRQARGGARATPPGPGPTTNTPPVRSGTGGELLHTPVPEQLDSTPLPVYVEPAGSLDAAHVYVNFRGNGMRQFQRSEMARLGGGWGVEIPCGQIIQPSMDYYITAVNDSGATIASTGSESQPVHVPIVTRRSYPSPSLPGRAAPETCSSADECPPGVTGPQCHRNAAHGSGGLGDPCSGTSDCGEGLRCDGGACAVGEDAGGGGNPDEPPAGGARQRSAFSRFSFDLGGGVGFAFLSGRMTYAEQFQTRTGAAVCGTLTCYTNIDPGFAPTGFLTANVRYNVTQRFGIGAGVRFQFDAAPWSVTVQGASAPKSNPLANLLLYLRGYYAFTPGGFAPTGMVGSVFAGGGAGQIEPKPGPPNDHSQSAHIVSGYGNIQAGGRVEYGMRNGFHVAGELTLHFMVPTFLFDADLAALIGFHF